MVHYRYIQTYKDIPIELTMYIVHVKDGYVTSFNGHALNVTTNLSSKATVNVVEAMNAAKNYVGALKYKWEDVFWEKNIKESKKDINATYFPKGELYWYAEDINTLDKKTNLRLAYKFDIYSSIPDNAQRVYVDAKTGEVFLVNSLKHN
ncbi:MAG: hypothetical protein IPO27_12445 [Bacteroidetes bacterium]|nr:hypothetical protein [Bacteroidota bacterium]